MTEISLWVAFGAGLLSFLSPCVLPLIPAYVSFISGSSATELAAGASRFRALTRTMVFIGGFTLVFIAMGILFAGGGSLLGGSVARLGNVDKGLPPSRLISIISGILIIILGLNIAFGFLGLLSGEARLTVVKKKGGYLSALLFGMTFAAGWSPCIGPILASILLLAAKDSDPIRSMALLGLYSLGLATPFMLSSLFLDRMRPVLAFFKKRMHLIKWISAAILVGLGLSMVFGRMSFITSTASGLGYWLEEYQSAYPSMTTTIDSTIWFGLAFVLIFRAWKTKRSLGYYALPAFLSLLGVLELGSILSLTGALSSWLLFRGA